MKAILEQILRSIGKYTLYIALLLFSPYSILFSQAVEKKVYVGKFKSMNSSDNQEYSKTVAEKLVAYLNTPDYHSNS